MEKKNKIIKLIISVLIIAASVLLLAGFLGGKDLMYHLLNRGELGPLTREDIKYIEAETPEATSKDGTVNSADWKETYPEIVTTMKDNANNYTVVSYLEQDPYLVNVYEGYGFAKDYGSARGHEYCLEDVAKTERPHPMANCLTCKTPNFAKLVNDLGVSAYTMDFNDVMSTMEENVSCYTCHGNDAGNQGKITITHSYVLKALGDNADTIDAATLSCGQCHIEYYFTPSDKETMMPYDSVEAMTPEAILTYYDSMVMPDGTVGFYAPVFRNVEYRFATHVEDYVENFQKSIAAAGAKNHVFSCNCILNYLYGDLNGKKLPSFTGPITFGEVAYQLINQTLVYCEILG